MEGAASGCARFFAGAMIPPNQHVVVPQTSALPQTIVFDARCLQDPNYAPRGVGRHAAGLLQGKPGREMRLRLLGLIDPDLPPLADAARAHFDAVYTNAYAAAWDGGRGGRPAAFVSLSPMTHDPLFGARLLADARLLRVAVVYDFIPRREPERYLPGPADRLNYAVQLRWLARCTLFCPISQSAADDLCAMLAVPKRAVAVTGAALDPAFFRASRNRRPRRPSILVVGGGDPRKNPETVIRAHAASAWLQEQGVPLVIAGNYGPVQEHEFRAIAAGLGGRMDLLSVPGHLPEEKLLELYAEASVVACASRDEGFSLPVVEGMAAGAVVLASDIPAHAELVKDPDRRFPANDDAALGSLLVRALQEPAWRRRAIQDQASVWPQFLAEDVAARFWSPMLAQLDARERRPARPAVLRGARPRVAILSPLPPDRSGVADYTAATCPDLGCLVDLHLFTETENPVTPPGAMTVRPLSALPNLLPGYDRVIGVLGNSHFHTRIFELMQRYGSAAIAHDARMLGFYRVVLGEERALAQASRELGRPVGPAELGSWLADEKTLKALFLGEIAASAAPMVVHSHVTARAMRERHGVEAAYVPFSIYRPWRAEELTPACRAAARSRLGLPKDEVVVATFGYVHSSKGPEECIWALDFLRAWGIRARLHLVGGTENTINNGAELRALADRLGLGDAVHIVGSFVPEQVYRDYLVGADLAVQLRSYQLGGLSGALLDCAAAGLPCVTNTSLADAVGVPGGYTRTIPDVLNPLLLAEACADLVETGLTANRREHERQAYSEERSFAVYAQRLCQALHLDVGHGASVRATGRTA